MDEQIHEHLARLGIDRWSALRKTVAGARDITDEKRHREAFMTLTTVLRWMDDAERVEEIATDVKRAEMTGDVDGLLQAMARMVAME